MERELRYSAVQKKLTQHCKSTILRYNFLKTQRGKTKNLHSNLHLGVSFPDNPLPQPGTGHRQRFLGKTSLKEISLMHK